MKIKTSEATDLQLNWLVAKCRGIELHPMYMWGGKCLPTGGPVSDFYEHTTDWAQGGPIIEREKIATYYDTYWIRDLLDPEDNGERWFAELADSSSYGPAPLIAAMRCYVASKLGDEVEVPDELA